MKKRVLGLIIALCIILPISISAKALDLNVGTTVQYKIDAGLIQDNNEDQENITNYDFGTEARFKFLFLEATYSSLFTSKTASSLELDNLLTAGISFDLLNLIRLGVGFGPQYSVYFDGNGKALTSSTGTTFDYETALLESPCMYKVHVDLLLGKLAISANYTVPTTNLTLSKFGTENFDIGDFTPANLDNGKFGVSALISFI